MQTAVDKFGRIDGVVCVAGILRERMLFNMSEEEWDGVIDTHLKGTFTVFRAASAVMRKQEGGGSLVALHLRRRHVGQRGPGQLRRRQGRHRLARAQRRGRPAEVRRHRQRIAPVANTRMSANVPGGTAEIGEPEDVAPMVVYLLSDAARDVTGQIYTVVGGKVALWSQPREIREIVKDGRWTPQELAEKLPARSGSTGCRCSSTSR